MNIGDRVKVKEVSGFFPLLRHQEGVIVFLRLPIHVGVEWEKPIPFGHSCGGRGRDRCCLWFLPGEICLVSDPFVSSYEDKVI